MAGCIREPLENYQVVPAPIRKSNWPAPRQEDQRRPCRKNRFHFHFFAARVRPRGRFHAASIRAARRATIRSRADDRQIAGTVSHPVFCLYAVATNPAPDSPEDASDHQIFPTRVAR